MKRSLLHLSFLLLSATLLPAQSLNVTPTGVSIGSGVLDITVATPAGAEVLDWPTAGLSIRRFDDYNVMKLLQFGHINDSTYQTGANTWNFALIDNVGSKTTSDANTKLAISGPGSLILSPTGNVGIGTSNPSEKLEITGNTKTSGSATVGSLIVGTSTVLSTGYFESAEQAVPGNNVSITIPHGLGGQPKLISVALRCKVAENGWAVNDEILISSMHMVSNNHGVTVAVNSTNFKLVQFGYIYIHQYNGNSMPLINNANWRFIFRAWR